MKPYIDPGDQQERGTRRKQRRGAPLPQPGQGDLLRDTPPPKGPSEGEKRKEKALEKHEAGGRAPLIRMLRVKLKALYFARRFGPPNPEAFVSADDAVRILKNTGIVPQTEDGKEEPRNWLGALFKEPGWRYTGRTVPSLRPELNGRHVRAWAWEGV